MPGKYSDIIILILFTFSYAIDHKTYILTIPGKYSDILLIFLYRYEYILYSTGTSTLVQ